ncbi:hypothetical protein BDY21DRAFT_292790 [Lineolata rhizophorae]|uniref:RA-domain-containing protein n=1 Tax=Lineolata rhizophorae TaxID=578093 RepID=A0A6A6NPZ6_9PEZI|nr:hypothetical protein BDY21DRAFT_292790 [Lineolata rhizophorae]
MPADYHSHHPHHHQQHHHHLPHHHRGSSPTDSSGLSPEHTPTTFAHDHGSVDLGSPRGLITQWSAEQCADFVSNCGLEQYADAFIEEGVNGEALIELQHAELKEMGIGSVGHRLTVLKSVYEVKVKQNIPIGPDHYVPLSADPNSQEAPPTQDDIARIIHIIKDRDERILAAEAELRLIKEDFNRVSEENRKLREDILPMIRMAKDRSQPLPTPDDPHHLTSPPNTSQPDQRAGSSLSRKFSTKKLFLGSAPKNPSPTIHHDSTLDPSAAALAASNNLTGALVAAAGAGASQGQQPSSSSASPHAFQHPQPSPTSPAYAQSAPGKTPTAQAARGPPQGAAFDDYHYGGSGSATGTGGSSSNPQVEIFKSFRVSIDDPCHKVLPVALKKYNITADWRQYALYIVHGDQERCLGLNERPLILFKQLDKEGRKPMFMLRKHAAPQEGHVSTVAALPGAGLAQPGAAAGGPAGLAGVGGGAGFGEGGGAGARGGVQLPGGVL